MRKLQLRNAYQILTKYCFYHSLFWQLVDSSKRIFYHSINGSLQIWDLRAFDKPRVVIPILPDITCIDANAINVINYLEIVNNNMW